ncbi:hypothetical protein U1Q18_033969 [Sarracenia purpurea var. burkii]
MVADTAVRGGLGVGWCMHGWGAGVVSVASAGLLLNAAGSGLRKTKVNFSWVCFLLVLVLLGLSCSGVAGLVVVCCCSVWGCWLIALLDSCLGGLLLACAVPQLLDCRVAAHGWVAAHCSRTLN